ncbi:MAG: OmpA family protein [Bacteroidales bacterium]|nr:OmpA family protein [Bacteroidales bacterium]
MMKKIYFIVGVLFLMLFCGELQAQFDSQNKKAIESFKKAVNFLNYYKLDLAKESVEEAIRRDPNFSDAYLLQAEIYQELQWDEKVLESYLKVLELNPNKHPLIYLNVSEMEMEQGKYVEAKDHLILFLQFTNQRKEDQEIAQLLLRNCRFAIEAIKHPVAFEPINLGEAINTRFSEYFPVLTVDGKTLLFTRRIPVSMQTGAPQQEDFYVSQKVNNQWVKAIDMGDPINTEMNEGAPTLSADGRMLIFTACGGAGNDYGEGRDGCGSCDLFYTIRSGNRWSKPKNMGAPINTSLWESQPSLSADGRTLYFLRANKRQGPHDQDIYITHLQDNGKWTTPMKLPANINSPYREESVFIHPDGQTLYFSSCGWAGMGSSDIYKTTKISDTLWTDPKNLGYPINTFNEEHSFCVSSDGKVAFFASDREGGFGENDIYYFDLPEEVQAVPVTYMTGKTFDVQTRHTLTAQLELIDLESGKTVYKTTSDPTNGKFLVVLPTNKNYALNAGTDGYLFYSEHFELKEQPNAQPYYKDVPLQPIMIGEKMVLRNIFFDSDQYDLKPESQAELNKMVAFMQKNPTIKIEIQGHTDNSGVAAHNQILSENRAKSVFQYLVSKGIASQRLSYKGMGSSQPIESNLSEEGRSANRRTEYKIIEQ